MPIWVNLMDTLALTSQQLTRSINSTMAAVAAYLADYCEGLAAEGVSGKRDTHALWVRGVQPLLLSVGVYGVGDGGGDGDQRGEDGYGEGGLAVGFEAGSMLRQQDDGKAAGAEEGGSHDEPLPLCGGEGGDELGRSGRAGDGEEFPVRGLWDGLFRTVLALGTADRIQEIGEVGGVL